MPGGLGEADRGRHAGIGHRHHDIGVDAGLGRELGAETLAHVIDVAAVDDRIRPGEIDVFEDAGAGRDARERLDRFARQSSVMTTISPFSTSRTKRAPMMSRAQVSEQRI